MNDQVNPKDGPHVVHGTVFRSRWALIGFLLVITYSLFTEHRAYVTPFLPFLLFATRPLMYLFMYHGHQDEEGEPSTHVHPKGE